MLLFVAAMALTCAIANPLSAVDGSVPDSRGLRWLYDSPLEVDEQIFFVGDGVFRYEYSFTNTDQFSIWHVVVYVGFPLLSAWEWSELPLWYAACHDLDDVHEAYDPRDLWPELAYAVNTFADGVYETTDPIAPGMSVSGFGFEAGIFDPLPKLYVYETLDSGWAQLNGGWMAAAGYTGGVVRTEAITWRGVKGLFE